MGTAQDSNEKKPSALVIAVEDYERHAKLKNLSASGNELVNVLGQAGFVDE